MSRADYPQAIVEPGHVEPVPRRVRGMLGGHTVLDTARALYLWEWPYYPQFLIPAADADAAVLGGLGDAVWQVEGHPDHVRIRWDALDGWFEEDEEVFVHPRNPYTRVDALRSTRTVRVEIDGVAVAESSAPVMVFETGLPTRYYVDRAAVDFTHLQASETQTPCPYKGRTSAYWSFERGGTSVPDAAWSYDFPTRQLLPIAGLVAFYNEQVDISIDGERQPRPRTHFST